MAIRNVFYRIKSKSASHGFRSYNSTDKGQILVTLAVGIPLLLGLLGLVIDIGFIAVTKAKLQSAADAAALAGVMDLAYSPATAVETAVAYATENSTPATTAAAEIDNSGRKLIITVAQNVHLLFGPWIGSAQQHVTARASATIGTAGSMRGMRPLAVVWTSFNYGTLYTIRYDPHDHNPANGNFGSVALGGNGASVYTNNLQNGYAQPIAVGQLVTSEPGNMVGPTQAGFSALLAGCTDTWPNVSQGCSRVITVIVVDALPSGRGTMQVRGFAAFFIESVTGGQVTGRFIEWVVPGNIVADAPLYGTLAARLGR